MQINANNANVDGSYDLGMYTLIYVIKGNGSNIREFKVVMNNPSATTLKLAAKKIARRNNTGHLYNDRPLSVISKYTEWLFVLTEILPKQDYTFYMITVKFMMEGSQMKCRITLDTMKDIIEFVGIATKIPRYT